MTEEQSLGDIIEDRNTEISELKAKIAVYESQISGRNNKQNDQTIEELKDIIEDQTTEISELKAKIAVYEAQVGGGINKKKTQEIENLKNDFASQKAGYEKRIAELEKQLNQQKKPSASAGKAKLQDPDAKCKNRVASPSDIQPTDRQNRRKELVLLYLNGDVDREDEINRNVAKRAFDTIWKDLLELMGYASLLKKEKAYKEKCFRDKFENDKRLVDMENDANTTISTLLECLCVLQDEVEDLTSPSRSDIRIPMVTDSDKNGLAKIFSPDDLK